MKIRVPSVRPAALAGVVLVGTAMIVAAADTASDKGLELTAKGVERSSRVSLQDCPPGENIVNGVIRPVEDNEFASIQIDVKVLPAFEGGEVPKPLLYDDAGNEYKTAQSFRDVASQDAYSCNFAFRVPKGTKITRVAIEDVSLDLSGLEK
jgi:hypothetical protein